MVKLLFIDVFLLNVDYWILVFVVEKEDIVNFLRNLILFFF